MNEIILELRSEENVRRKNILDPGKHLDWLRFVLANAFRLFTMVWFYMRIEYISLTLISLWNLVWEHCMLEFSFDLMVVLEKSQSKVWGVKSGDLSGNFKERDDDMRVGSVSYLLILCLWLFFSFSTYLIFLFKTNYDSSLFTTTRTHTQQNTLQFKES